MWESEDVSGAQFSHVIEVKTITTGEILIKGSTLKIAEPENTSDPHDQIASVEQGVGWGQKPETSKQQVAEKGQNTQLRGRLWLCHYL